MSWAKLDDGMWSHPKFLDLSNGAIGVWAKALSWSAQQLRDGAIPRALKAMMRATDAEVAELVNAELWDETEDGWQIHDYLAFNPSRESVLAERDKGKERAKASHARRRKEKSDSSGEDSHSSPDLREIFAVSSGDPSRPVPTRPENSNQKPCERETNTSVPAPASERSRPDLVGFRWYCETLNLLPTSAPAPESWRRQYEFLGSKPASEQKQIAAYVQADEWCQANKHRVTPEHLKKNWTVYLGGDLKPVLKPVVATPREQLEKARERLQDAAKTLRIIEGLPWFDKEKPTYPGRLAQATADVSRLRGELAKLESGFTRPAVAS